MFLKTRKNHAKFVNIAGPFLTFIIGILLSEGWQSLSGVSWILWLPCQLSEYAFEECEHESPPSKKQSLLERHCMQYMNGPDKHINYGS